ncbi:MAG: hypothetical protein C0608_04305 [Deltaproteobacteria bacterium]|nr:MAG: hypothetical protein C0608_04305 [Deltaproteobacteria bacterium]
MTEAPLAPSNARVKYLKRLLSDPKVRRSEGVWIAEGVRLVEEVISSGVNIRTAFFAEDFTGERHEALRSNIRERAAETWILSKGAMRQVSDTQSPQGVGVVIDPPPFEEKGLLATPKPIVILDRLRDPGNLGTIARSALAAGAGAIILTADSVDAGNPKALRASAGALLRLPVMRASSKEWLRRELQRPIYATTGEGGTLPEERDLAAPFALVMGQEASGLDPAWEALVDGFITIPMEGEVESLNVATATGVILFEAARQRRSRG